MVSFTETGYLLLFILLPLLLYMARSKRSFTGLSQRRILLIKIFRFASVLFIVLAIAGISIKTALRDRAIIFLVDRSDSISRESQKKIDGFIADSIKLAKKDDKIGLVYFGANPQVEYLPNSKREGVSYTTVIDGKSTNVADAMQVAVSLFPSNYLKKIILFTDGNNNEGDIEKAVNITDLSEVETDVVPLESLGKNEVMMLSLDMPSRARVNEQLEATALIESDYQTNANIILSKEGKLISNKAVSLNKGINKVGFQVTETEGGFNTYDVRVELPGDNYNENNIAAAAVYFEGSSRVLVISDNDDGRAIGKALSASGVNAEMVKASDLRIAQLDKYAAVMLVNIPYAAIGDDNAKKIKDYVKNVGGGLVVLGGGDSLGPGGYLDTPVEEVLPVKMDVPNRKRSPSVAQVLVIDKSGSMGACHCAGGPGAGDGRSEGGVVKVELSKTAALKASHMLTARDYFGVVATDDKAFWAHPLGSPRGLNPAVGSLKASGGTNVYQGVELGYEGLKKVNAVTKHLLVITDGWTDLANIKKFIPELNESGITLSIIAAGEGSAKELNIIAAEAKGRFYPMTNLMQIPEITAKEVKTALRPYISEKPFYPAAASSNIALNALGGKSRLLKGHILTTIKPTAEQALVSDEGDPVLSVWQYGLGRSAVWTSDAGQRWAGDWFQSGSSAKFWSSVVQQVFPRKSKRKFDAGFERRGRDIVMSVNSPIKESGTEVFANVSFPSGHRDEVRLDAKSAGHFTGKIEADEEGAHFIKINIMADGKEKLSDTFSFISSYPSEYLYRTVNKKVLNTIVDGTGGYYLQAPGEVFRKFRLSYLKQEIWRLLILFALFLFFTDIVLRKLVMTRQDILEIKNDIRKWFDNRRSGGGKKEGEKSSPMMERLSQAKKRATDS